MNSGEWRTLLKSLAIGTAVCFISGCRNASEDFNLRERIIAARAVQYCHLPDACFNPHILAVESGYEVTTFLGFKPQYAHVPTKNLAKYLSGLPMQVWPQGSSISISPTDDVTDWHAVDENLRAAQHLCQSMGLDVKILHGGTNPSLQHNDSRSGEGVRFQWHYCLQENLRYYRVEHLKFGPYQEIVHIPFLVWV
jgi:hypothetical protein